MCIRDSSHIDHLKAMIAEAKKRGVKKVAVHALIDGRDVGETSALDYIEPFEAWLAGIDPAYGNYGPGYICLLYTSRCV